MNGDDPLPDLLLGILIGWLAMMLALIDWVVTP